MIKPLQILLFLTLLFTIAACSKEERDPCLQPRITLLRAHAYRRADTGTAILDTLLPNPLLVPLTGGNAQVYYGGVKRIGLLTFSLSENVDSSSWIVRPDSAFALQDTLTFYYDRQLRFLSNACGFTNFYNLQRVHITTHALDSAIIANGSVTTDANVQHVKLYY